MSRVHNHQVFKSMMDNEEYNTRMYGIVVKYTMRDIRKEIWKQWMKEYDINKYTNTQKQMHTNTNTHIHTET